MKSANNHRLETITDSSMPGGGLWGVLAFWGLHDDKQRTHRGQEHPIALEHAQRTRELAFDKLDEERT